MTTSATDRGTRHREDRVRAVPRPGRIRWSGGRVVAAGVAMVLGQLLFRAWAAYPSWFYFDDYAVLNDAVTSGFGVEYLLEPYAGHLMPGTRALAWVVAQAGALSWGLAATLSLLVQAAASFACLWMLLTLFGRKPLVLVPLAVYLTTALTTPAFTWWVSSLNHFPVHASFFLAVGAWVAHLRTATPLTGLATAAAVCGGLAFDVRAVFVLPVLAFLAVAYFSEGGPVTRVRDVLRRYRGGFALLVLVGGSYTAVYLLAIPKITTGSGLRAFPAIASEMIGSTFVAAVLGGPWVWDRSTVPTALSGTPTVLVSAGWVVLAGFVTYLALRRRHTLRAWVLVLGYLLALAALVASARSDFGDVAARELRFLTNSACVVVLALALALLPLLGARESSEPRPHPRVGAVPRPLVALALAVVLVSGLVSSAQYAAIWHAENPSRGYVQRLGADLARVGAIDAAATRTPGNVLSPLQVPRNNTRTLIDLLTDQVRFPEVSSRLAVVDDQGALALASVQPVARSEPGPTPGCGWRVDADGATIPLRNAALDADWWVRIGYLGATPSPVTLQLGETTVETDVATGLNTLYVRVRDTFDEVTVSGLDADAAICVDTVQVGSLEPVGPL